MRRKNRIKEKAGENHEPFNDDIYLDKNSEQIPIDEQFEKIGLGWIEIIEDPNLQQAMKKLSKDEQIFITQLLFENYTQQELADKHKINKSSVYYKINKIKRKIKNRIYKIYTFDNFCREICPSKSPIKMRSFFSNEP